MRAAAYVRVSTRDQAEEGLSLDIQRAAIAEYCKRRGWTVVEEIVDDGYSGRNEDRPGYQRLMTLMGKRNRPDVVVVARLDRLTRSLAHLVELIDRADRRWGIVALDMDLNTLSANGQFVIHVLGAVARWESRMISERVSASMRAAHAEARSAGRPLGFQRQASDDVVRLIVRARKRGEPYNRIAARLDKQGIAPPGGGLRWYPSTVARIYKAAL